ncbi:protein required for attachment to host cells [Caulobacter ginsengisoli]|uniref:Protein required for attachment to host cells n=1 Tax=Caulobacter ginsengisoli TaxID=400775 RepID=A0ABU0IKH5_9CAUL|nr:host attachment protein [Caulobacter ginsengisoli]MDQ0462513.1 protein required for attachment to host cells [Caulobacter ginsengisoli]
MILPNGALVAVVDGEQLVLFRNTGHAEPVLTAVEVPAMAERVSGASAHRSSAANPDNDTQAEDGYATGVAELLNGWALAGRFEGLLVIAAPRTLGELRKHWHKDLQARLIGEINKDLTGQTAQDIAAAIDKA